MLQRTAPGAACYTQSGIATGRSCATASTIAPHRSGPFRCLQCSRPGILSRRHRLDLDPESSCKQLVMQTISHASNQSGRAVHAGRRSSRSWWRGTWRSSACSWRASRRRRRRLSGRRGTPATPRPAAPRSRPAASPTPSVSDLAPAARASGLRPEAQFLTHCAR